MPAKQHELNNTEERALDAMAERSEFWSRIRAAYAEWGSLTERQYEIFREQRERDAWRDDARTVGGLPVRNRYETKDGRPRCACREKPYCQSPATVIVGVWGYCADHADAAREDLERWRASRTPKEGLGGGEGVGSPPAPPAPPDTSRTIRFAALLAGDDDDVPF